MTDQSDRPAKRAEDTRAAVRRRIDRVNDWLHLGGALPPEDFGRLAKAGVTHIIDLREEALVDQVLLRRFGIIRQHVPVPNQAAPSMDQLREVADLVEPGKKDASVYVHCSGGFGRAATMAVGLLVYQGISVNDAIRQVRQARPEIQLNEVQLAWLSAVEAQRRT